MSCVSPCRLASTPLLCDEALAVPPHAARLPAGRRVLGRGPERRASRARRWAAGALALALAFLVLFPHAGRAQPPAPARELSLGDALALATRASDALRVARAGVRRVAGEQLQARSRYYPQLTGTASYTRTLRTQYAALGGGAEPVDTLAAARPTLCAPIIAPDASAAERAAALGQASTCVSPPALDLSQAGFGAPNRYAFGLDLSMTVLDGGATRARTASATAARRSAEIELAAQQAQLTVDVAERYYDAALSDLLVAIADSSLGQSERVVRQTSAARSVGSQSGYELLRAQVTRDNQVPTVLQRRSERDIAYARLAQLLGLTPGAALRLTTPVEDAGAGGARFAALVRRDTPAPDTSADARAAVRQEGEAVRQQEAALRVTRAQRLPALNLTSSFGRIAFPAAALRPSVNDLRTDWTVGLTASVPLFTGGRIRGEARSAQARVDEARARLDRARDQAALDTRQTVLDLAQAEAALAANARTVDQAGRAYQIAEVRYREGVERQTELADARIALAQSQSNRARAARDLQVARVRFALLRDLPASTTRSTAP